MEKIEYVVGFLFSKPRTHVLLIRKNRPSWQKGRWNGPGGKIEPGETPEHAMRREFVEETGLGIQLWEKYATLNTEHAVVHFFRAFSDAMWTAESVTDERVEPFLVCDLPTGTFPNAAWLIPMALSMDDDSAGAFSVQELAA